jgi:poly(3-hydroxybutyrate) depolymerase
VQGAGHYGIFSGRRWREKVYPVVRDFIARHQPRAAGTETADVESEAALMAAAIQRDSSVEPTPTPAASRRRRRAQPGA